MVHVMLTGNLSRFDHLIGDETTGVRSESAFETYSILEKENTPAFHSAEVERKKRACPKDGVVGDGALVAPKAVRFAVGVPEGTIDEIL